MEVEYPTVRRKKKADAVAEWLRSMGLERHEGRFIDNGYDDLDFLGDDVIDDKVLADQLDVADKGERDAIMEQVAKNRRVKGEILCMYHLYLQKHCVHFHLPNAIFMYSVKIEIR